MPYMYVYVLVFGLQNVVFVWWQHRSKSLASSEPLSPHTPILYKTSPIFCHTGAPAPLSPHTPTCMYNVKTSPFFLLDRCSYNPGTTLRYMYADDCVSIAASSIPEKL